MKYVLRILLAGLILASCDDKNEFDLALVQTGDVTAIASDGALFSGKILSTGEHETKEVGFVWSDHKSPSIELSEKLVVQGASGVFSARVTTTLVKDLTYYVRAYILTKETISYGREVSFKSLGSAAPSILDLNPRQGNLGEMLVIAGRNFSVKPTLNIVEIGGQATPVLKATNDSLWVRVPETLSTSQASVSVSIVGNKATSEFAFEMFAPAPTSFNPGTGSLDQAVVISGSNFSKHPASLKVHFNDTEAIILSATDSEIEVKVPLNVATLSCDLFVSMNNLKRNVPGQFQISEFAITDFSPEVVLTGETITLTGTGFIPTLNGNTVTIGGHVAQVVASTSTELKVIVPLQEGRRYESRNVSVTVESFDKTKTFGKTLLINDNWFRVKDFPGQMDYQALAVESGDNFFVWPNYNYEFYKFDPFTGNWTKLEDCPQFGYRTDAMVFSIGPRIYFGTGQDYYYNYFPDISQYDTESNAWQETKGFPLAITGLTSFSIGSKAYALSASVIDGAFWEYNENTDEWTNLPVPEMIELEFSNIGLGLGLGDRALYGMARTPFAEHSSRKMFSFNPSKAPGNEWERIADFPVEANASRRFGFDFDGRVIVSATLNGPLYEYDEESDSWIEFPTNNFNVANAVSGFSANGRIYLILSNKEFWEYDPNR